MAPRPSRKRTERSLTTFGRLLQGHLARQELTIRAYAAAIGTPYSYVSRVMYGDRPPKLDSLATWIKPLELTITDREIFEFEAIVATCNLEAQALIRELKKQSER